MRIIIVVIVFASVMIACKNKKTKTEVVEQEAVEESLTASPDPEAEGRKWIAELKKNLPDSLFIRIKRTACFGRCPIYTLSIYEGGTAVYEGEKFVEKEGRYEAYMADNQVQRLREIADSIAYQSLDEVYDNINVTDLPSTITAIRIEEDFKVVANRYGAPEKLVYFENAIDQMAEKLDWKKIAEK